MKIVFTIQIEEFGEETLCKAKTADSIPAPNEFDSYTVGDLVLLAFPVRILDSTSVSIPDTSEPLAGFFLFQNAVLADQSGETATGEAATGEAKEEELIADGVVIDKEVVGGEDVFVDAVADGTWWCWWNNVGEKKREQKERLLPLTSEGASDIRCRTRADATLVINYLRDAGTIRRECIVCKGMAYASDIGLVGAVPF